MNIFLSFWLVASLAIIEAATFWFPVKPQVGLITSLFMWTFYSAPCHFTGLFKCIALKYKGEKYKKFESKGGWMIDSLFFCRYKGTNWLGSEVSTSYSVFPWGSSIFLRKCWRKYPFAEEGRSGIAAVKCSGRLNCFQGH